MARSMQFPYGVKNRHHILASFVLAFVAAPWALGDPQTAREEVAALAAQYTGTNPFPANSVQGQAYAAALVKQKLAMQNSGDSANRGATAVSTSESATASNQLLGNLDRPLNDLRNNSGSTTTTSASQQPIVGQDGVLGMIVQTIKETRDQANQSSETSTAATNTLIAASNAAVFEGVQNLLDEMAKSRALQIANMAAAAAAAPKREPAKAPSTVGDRVAKKTGVPLPSDEKDDKNDGSNEVISDLASNAGSLNDVPDDIYQASFKQRQRLQGN